MRDDPGEWRSKTSLSRRDMLARFGGGFGAVALAWLLAGELARGSDASPLAPKPPHLPARAPTILHLMHVDASRLTYSHKGRPERPSGNVGLAYKKIAT